MYSDEWRQMVEEVTCKDVVDFFSTLPSKGNCPICQDELVAFKAINRRHRSFKEIPDKPAIAWKTVHEGEPPFERIAIPILTSRCDTCGYMADFSFHALLEWKVRNGN
ncbi:hypothetical protein [Vreelandella sedimenti]|uniref:hypothetical protein n=1 Tax=Vreelandella TaxID=3137766 RepID=UPI002579BDB5|nr:hypothetical protein [Halomonas sp. UBA3173]